ncbi:MAG: hypothetical protein ACK41C_15680 [Phenylobacterium sp.]|jgi:hypothetical protein|uniref:hypothetical protein n=1 Tax=Phenylobacterium sp. TaxID=1871053 RepID=UPI00391DB4CB
MLIESGEMFGGSLGGGVIPLSAPTETFPVVTDDLEVTDMSDSYQVDEITVFGERFSRTMPMTPNPEFNLAGAIFAYYNGLGFEQIGFDLNGVMHGAFDQSSDFNGNGVHDELDQAITILLATGGQEYGEGSGTGSFPEQTEGSQVIFTAVDTFFASKLGGGIAIGVYYYTGSDGHTYRGWYGTISGGVGIGGSLGAQFGASESLNSFFGLSGSMTLQGPPPVPVQLNIPMLPNTSGVAIGAGLGLGAIATVDGTFPIGSPIRID